MELERICSGFQRVAVCRFVLPIFAGERAYTCTNGRLSKVWVQRLRINGRATNLGLGSFPVVGLATARERALDNRRKIEVGIDPRIAENPTPTLADALEAVIEGRSASWKNGGRSAEIWRNSVRNHAYNLRTAPCHRRRVTAAEIKQTDYAKHRSGFRRGCASGVEL